MSKSKYKQPVTETDKIDLEILRLLTPAQKKTLKDEINKFQADFKFSDCESLLSAILIGLVGSNNTMVNGTIRSNCVNFIGRITSLLRALYIPTPTELP